MFSEPKRRMKSGEDDGDLLTCSVHGQLKSQYCLKCDGVICKSCVFQHENLHPEERGNFVFELPPTELRKLELLKTNTSKMLL